MTAKSCLNCPSLLALDDSTFFRKAIGVPICSRFGKPIGRINSDPEETRQVAMAFASTCSSFGLDKPGSPDWSKATFQVTFPDMDILGQEPNDDRVKSCAGCVNFIPEHVVATELGWTTAVCAAKGKLLYPNRYNHEARTCVSRQLGSVRETTTGLTYLPEYEANFVGAGDPSKKILKSMSESVDPNDYETDAPVSVEDARQGIRAWRRIKDSETTNSVLLPIFDRSFFAPELAELIPSTGDDEHPEDYLDHGSYVYKVAVLWRELDETPAFWGKAGTGKTEFFRHMAYLMQVPFYRFSITASTELDDLAGKMHYTEGVGTHFEKGRMVNAWESACVMVVDEPNAGPPDVWQFLRPMTDNSKQLVLDQSAGERSLRNDNCYLGMAMNPAWDIINLGAQPIGDADANRLMHLYIELPDPKLEREIIRKRCEHDGFEISKNQLDTVMKIADELRSMTDNGTLSISWGIRPQIKAARALRWFDFATAYRMASADYLEPEQQQLMLNAVNAHV